jgi:hypothetical protein
LFVEPEYPRALTENERMALDFLLSADFDGAAQLREQARTAVVTGLCPCGCPTFNVSVDRARCAHTEVAEPIPVEAASTGPFDEPPLQLLLFVRKGWLESVELVWYGDQAPQEFPPVQSFAPPVHRPT